MSNYILKIHKDGEIRYCAEIIGFPVTLRFIDAHDHEQPHYFTSKDEALEYWRLFQRYKPADTTGWFEEAVEL